LTASEDTSVRQAVLTSLEERLDYQLARAEYVSLLVIALHDEVVEIEVVDIRILAMKVVGRLASYNPGDVLPSLRKTLIRVLTELKCSVTS
jgi:serine/threonine-protein kinase mTOR